MGEGDRERWDARHEGSGPPGPAPAWLSALAHELPTRGRALELASGKGALSLWLAARGLDVIAVDVSPVALSVLDDEARQRGVTVQTRVLDLTRAPPPPGPFELIACLHYRQPELLPTLVEALSVGGVLALEQHTTDNLSRHARPSRRFLAEPQELVRWAVSRGLAIVSYREGWVDDRTVARLLARR